MADTSAMPSDGVNRILKFEVPIIVRMGEKKMPMKDVLALVPGMIIELPKSADEPLDLCVNNKAIGTGTAVKVGENFGLKVTFIGRAEDRIKAMGSASQPASSSDDEFAALAEQMLAGQL